ncbi:MAG: DUF1189 family protein [Nitrospirae bacterium]|nr:DUF1189 family protein [Nitrospirota bacterium]
MSFFSKDLYRDVARNRSGLCMTYLVILLSLSLIPDMVRLHNNVSDFLAEEAPKIVSQVPTVTISKGVASIKEPVPYVIKAPWSKLPFAIIDTSEGTVPAAKLKATVVLTKTKLLVNDDATDIHSVDLSHIQNLIIDRDLINRWIEQFKDYFIFAVYPFALFFTFLYYLIQVLICASIGMLFAKMHDLKLLPRALVRLSAVAFTPPIVLQTLHSLLNIEFPYSSVISLLFATCYLYFAVGACSGKTISKIA